MRATDAHPLDGDDRWAISVPEAGRRLDISRAHAYRLVASGELPSLRLGHRTVVPVWALEAILTVSGTGWPTPVVGVPTGPVDTSGPAASSRLDVSDADRGDASC